MPVLAACLLPVLAGVPLHAQVDTGRAHTMQIRHDDLRALPGEGTVPSRDRRTRDTRERSKASVKGAAKAPREKGAHVKKGADDDGQAVLRSTHGGRRDDARSNRAARSAARRRGRRR